jgi:hypothetical protein
MVVVPVQAARPPAPEALDFVRFCYHRRRVSWPDLYDEMCAVAARGTFRGWGYEELESLGISFTLSAMPGLSVLAQQVAAEERAAHGRLTAVRVEVRSELPEATNMPGLSNLAPVSG